MQSRRFVRLTNHCRFLERRIPALYLHQISADFGLHH
jgi:hypothetical protein